MNKEKRIDFIVHGVAASAGVAFGKAFVFQEDVYNIEKRTVLLEFRSQEKKRLEKAFEDTKADIEVAHIKLNSELGKDYARIIDAHLLMLEDPDFKKDVFKFISEGDNAEYAVHKVINKITASFETIKDDYFKERIHDIRDVGEKIIDNLLGKKKESFSNLQEGCIVVAHNLTPAETISIREKKIKGFATDIGGKTSHTAIVAQGLAIPAVTGLRNIASIVCSGDEIIINGNKGIAILNPSNETIDIYKKELDIELNEKKELENLKKFVSVTIDNHKVGILANIDDPGEAKVASDNGAEGIGLYRTEFMYFNREVMPVEKEHFEKYCEVANQMSDLPIIIRTIDLGGDKLAKLGLLDSTQEKNPFMGLRAIRLCLKYPKIFRAQLKGILMASAFGDIRIMYPMISGIEELRAANKILEQVKKELKTENVAFNENIKIGVMIEIPSAVLIARELAKEVDFVSIGTNDLIQYSLAVDRVNENVANLYDPLHPSILRFIKKIIDDAHAEGVKVSVCGEMAADTRYTGILLGFGLDEFSVVPSRVLKIKKTIRGLSFEKSQEMVLEILKSSEKQQILDAVDRFNEEFKCLN
ncbi:MAG: phosphoenolpyruvate--protein phosphotransferase [Elusimicrobiota bacterium]|jgi:phosphotransferase system enzyme I (PtsI)|nr:phosphoenolpyruvate--protein phosphotransferase [Elusimicrobiota bacterium]